MNLIKIYYHDFHKMCNQFKSPLLLDAILDAIILSIYYQYIIPKLKFPNTFDQFNSFLIIFYGLSLVQMIKFKLFFKMVNRMRLERFG